MSHPQIAARMIHDGNVVQSQKTEYVTYTTYTAVKALDDNIPTNAQGTELYTVSITPKSASNILRVTAHLYTFMSQVSGISAWVCRDAVVNALATGYISPGGSGYGDPIHISFDEVAGSVSATTFKVRIGVTAGTGYINGWSGRKFGGTLKSFICVQEIQA